MCIPKRRQPSARGLAGTTTPVRATRCSPLPTLPYAPWYVARSDDKRRARLNLIRHLLSRIPYKDVTRNGRPDKLPERQKPHGYVEPDYPYKYVSEKY